MAEISTFRLGDLSETLTQRAKDETESTGQRITPSTIVKRALRAYLVEDIQQHIDAHAIIGALKELRIDLARVGGNLNQISYGFNLDGRIDSEELKKVHRGLQIEFRKISSGLSEIEREMYGRR